MLKAIECSHGVVYINPGQLVDAKIIKRQDMKAPKEGREKVAVEFNMASDARYVFKGNMEDFLKALK